MHSTTSDDIIRQQVVDIIVGEAHVEASVVRPETTLKDLGLDSLEAIELLFDLEERFDITFPSSPKSFDNETVQDLLNAIRNALDDKAAGRGTAA